MQLPRSLPGSGAADDEAARRRLETLAWSLDRPVGPEQPTPVEPVSVEPASLGSVTSAGDRSPGRHAARGLSTRARVAARLLDTVPSTMRGRWGISAQHVTVVALVVASALALAAWWVVRARPEPVSALPVPASTVVESLPDGGTSGVSDTSGTPSASPAATLVVHVAGKVKRPGIVSLPAGSRVIDALQEAGGPRRGVDLSALNLARPLADGEQILVGIALPPGAVAPAPPGAPGAPGAAGAPGAPGAAGGLVNLNTATSAQLEELPGVGPVTAGSILEWRAEQGRFSSVDELLEVSGIGEVTLAELRDLVTV